MIHKIPVRDVNGLANILSKGNHKQKKRAAGLHRIVLEAVKDKIEFVYLDDNDKYKRRTIVAINKSKLALLSKPERG